MIRYFDMFAGVGGFRAGLTRAGGFACVGHSEIDRYADASYRAIHNPKESEVFYADARTIEPDDLPDFDLLCGGFPCQAFSLAEKDAALKMGEVLCFLNWRVSPLPKDLRICYLKMYPVSCRMIRGKPSPASSTRFANWGMAWNGWCLTRRITESPSPGGECSLSAFLIKDAPEKYYLTGKQTRRLLYGWQEESKDTPSTTPKA